MNERTDVFEDYQGPDNPQAGQVQVQPPGEPIEDFEPWCDWCHKVAGECNCDGGTGE